LLRSEKGTISLQPVYHGSLVISWNNKTIYIDPYGGPAHFAGLKAPDLVLITDIHADHMDTATLAAIKTSGAVFIVPQAVADQLPAHFRKHLLVIQNGDMITEKGISISAIPMYNTGDSRVVHHPKGRGNGYVLNLGGKLIYISGDTGDIDEMHELKDIDVAFVCMNTPYTMDPQQAAHAVLAFKPKIVYPYHYRGQDGFSDLDVFRKIMSAGDPDIEVRIRKWYGTH
jgi:L-ascorbate metabolism protein UlaG (beta-lactamase superfamily)